MRTGTCLLETRTLVEEIHPEQRLALAHQYLDKHAFLTVSIYRQLTGLVRSTATVELRKWAHTPGSGIDTSGIGSHKVYVKRKESVIP